MGSKRYLMDSNAVIDYLGRKFTLPAMEFMSEVVDAIPFVSIITKIEVLGFTTSDTHMRLLADFMNDAVVVELTEEVAQTAIQIRRIHKIKLPDAIIAATALTSSRTLLTRNISDFKNIEGLDYTDPHTL